MADDHCTATMIDTKLGMITHKTFVEPIELVYASDKSIYKAVKKLYADALSPTSCIEIVKDNRPGGAKVIATKFIPKRFKIIGLTGRHYPISKHFIKRGVNDFSILTSQLTKKDKIFLGPCSFVNHDCKPNTVWISRNKLETCVETVRDIKKDEDITVYYSPYYFGVDNEECKCRTCEKTHFGYFKQKGFYSACITYVEYIFN